jgi:hypothetical protein
LIKPSRLPELKSRNKLVTQSYDQSAVTVGAFDITDVIPINQPKIRGASQLELMKNDESVVYLHSHLDSMKTIEYQSTIPEEAETSITEQLLNAVSVSGKLKSNLCA